MNIELEQQVTIDLDKLTDADRKAVWAAAWAQSDERSAMNRYIEYGVGLLEGK